MLNCSYNPHRNNTGNHLKELNDFLDLHSSPYEKVLILDDFIVEADYQNMKHFYDSYSIISLIKQPTSHNNPYHPKCIDLILANMPRSFQATYVTETGLSDFHLMTLTVRRKIFKKLKPRVINYRSCKHFSNQVFKENLLEKLSQQTFVNNDYGFQKFCNVTLKTLDKYAPRKAKHARGNQMPIMIKDLFKNFIKRSRLGKKYLKNSEENRKLHIKQRNYRLSLVRKTEKAYNNKFLITNFFWKLVKLSLSMPEK